MCKHRRDPLYSTRGATILECAVEAAPVTHMAIRAGFSGTIGETPLIRLTGPSDETGCNILAKAEFLNPGGSVKDRAALFIIDAAEKSGALRPGGTRRRGHRGQHRHRLGAHLRRARLPLRDRHSRQPVEREDGTVAHARRRGTAGAAKAVCRSTTTTRRSRRGWRPSCRTRSGRISSTTSSTGRRTSKRRGPNSGAIPAAGSTPLPAQRAPAARWRAWPAT